MDNFKKPRDHNYLKKFLRLEAEGKLPPGVGIHALTVKHDDYCRLMRDGSVCDCDPDIYHGERRIE